MASTHVARVSAGGVSNRAIAPSIYYTCDTAAATAAKVITTDSTNKWTSADLFEGLTIFVKFKYANTVASPTLNIDSIGAKPIYRYGTTAPSTSAASSWNANSVVGLTYDTTLNSSGCWVMHDWNNTTYSALSQSDATAGTSTTSRLITAKVLSDTIDEKINGLPTPMQFIGTVGTDGTVTWANLTAAATANTGYTYKVITDHSAETGKPAAKAGDTIISNGSEWIVIPSGDEPSGTVTSITLKAGTGISLDTDNTAITSSGTRTISHADTSSQSSSSNSGRTYIQSVTLDDYGHVTGLSTATEDVTNTDTKLQVAAVTSGTTYYPIVGTGTTAATRQYDTTGLVYVGTNGTANGTNGNSLLTLGNSTASTTANWKKGTVRLYGTTAYYTDVVSGAPTANRTITLPNATGTVALTSDIPTVPTTVSSFTNDAGYSTLTLGSTASTAAAGNHSHGNITNGGDITATAPTIANGDQIIINDNSASKITNGPTFDGSTTTTALTPKGTWETFSKFSGSYNDLSDKPTIPTDTNTTYTLSNALASHKFTETLTAGGSGSGTSTATMEFVAGTGITLTDDTTNKKITIACSVTDTDTKVKLTSKSDSVAYKVALGPSSITSGTAYEEYYSTNLTYNPSTKALSTGGAINGYTLAAASAKAVDTSISAGSSSANLPTSAAVATFVEGKGYITDAGVTKITTTAGTHTAITNSTGAVSFNVPTKTSHLTNDSGYVTTDTKNTAGSTDSSSKLFLIGATSQAANPQTYSQDTAYVGTDGHLYSNSIQVVNLSGSQALTNKTYNGYTLAAACAKGVDTSISSASSTNLPTTAAVTAYTDDIIVIDENEPTSALTKIWIKI